MIMTSITNGSVEKELLLMRGIIITSKNKVIKYILMSKFNELKVS